MDSTNESRVNFSLSNSTSCDTLHTNLQSQSLERNQGRFLSVPNLLNMQRKCSESSIAVLSMFSNQQKSDEVVKSYVKLKTYFSILCFLNAILVASAGAFLGIYLLNDKDIKPLADSSSSSEKTVNGSYVLKSSSKPVFIQCEILKARLNWRKPSKTGMNCSLGDVVEAIAEFKTPEKRILHMTNGVPIGGLRNEHDIAGWEVQISNSENAEAKNKFGYNAGKGTIIIPESGFYFIYTGLTFSLSAQEAANNPRLINSNIRYILRKKKLGFKFETLKQTSLKCANHSFVHGIRMEGSFFLRGGDELKVVISNTGYRQFDQMYRKENYFGIFSL